MSKQHIQNNYNTICARLGETEYKLAQLQAEKASLIKQAAELQKAWSMADSMEKEAQAKDASHGDGPSA